MGNGISALAAAIDVSPGASSSGIIGLQLAAELQLKITR